MAIKVSNGTDTFEVEEAKLGEAQKDGFVPTVKVSNGKETHDVHPNDLKLAVADGFKPEAPAAQERPWYDVKPSNLLPGALEGLKKIDEYTGAPIRKFVTEKIGGKELDHAPTGAEQAKMLGASDVTYKEKFGVPGWLGGNVSPADIYGVGLEAVQDPFLIAGAAKKGVTSLARPALEAAETVGSRLGMKAAQSQAASASAEAGARAGATISGGGATAEMSGQLFSKQAPQSLKELEQWTPKAGTGELPGAGRLKEIVQVLPDLETQPLKYHHDMMANPKSMKEMKIQFENLPSQSAKKIAAYNQQMVEESGRKVQETVSSLAPTGPRTLQEAGDDFISAVKDKYHGEQERLGPMFQELQQNALRAGGTETRDLAIALGENTKLGKLMETSPDGKLFLKPNSPRTGISNSEHGVLSEVIKDLNEGMTFKEMQDTRAYLHKSIDPANPSATAEISKVRSILLDQMESMANSQGPSVGATFSGWAKNERARESIEKVIGGKIEGLDAMYSANPERVVQKVFSNPNYAKVVGEYVGPEKMQEMVAAHIQNGVKGAYDSAKGFQPEKLRTWLKSNDKFLANYSTPEISQRLNALADYGYYGKRFLDEVNPSGTAASLVAALKPEGFLAKVSSQGVTGAVRSETIGRVDTALKQRQATKAVNESLGGAPKPTSRMSLQGPSSETIDRTVGAQFASASGRGTAPNMSSMRATADSDQNDAPKSGPTKWVNDGAKKLIEHDSSGVFSDPAVIEQLKKSQKGKDLLIEASGAKPGSKAMTRIAAQIKSQIGEN